MRRGTGREEAIRALKLHSKPLAGNLDADALLTSVDGETDRGAVIILATVVEDALASKIKSKMGSLNADEMARLFGPDGPLGSFSALIRMGQALGIIDRPLYRVCDIIREMRNACAHSRRPISFDDDVLKNALLACAASATSYNEEMPRFDQTGNCKYLFGFIVAYAYNWISKSRPVAERSQEALRTAIRSLCNFEKFDTLPDKPL
jgi:hypothetical protein